jgi:hypothetical protein
MGQRGARPQTESYKRITILRGVGHSYRYAHGKEGAQVTEALKRVERAAAKQARAHDDLHAAIRASRAQGESLRAIGKAAGLSHVHVQRIVDAST